MTTFHALARILFLATYRSRRLAKREIREAGGRGSAEELEAILTSIDGHEHEREIRAEAERMGEAHARTEAYSIGDAAALGRSIDRDADREVWIFGEDAMGVREFVVLSGPAWGFVAEVFESEEVPAQVAGLESHELGEGYVLGNIEWAGERPEGLELVRVIDECRRQFAIFNRRIEKDAEESNA